MVHNSTTVITSSVLTVLLLFKIHAMKKLLLMSVAFITLLSACSPDLHLDITKRRYRKGFHVDAGSLKRPGTSVSRSDARAEKMPIHVKDLTINRTEPTLTERHSTSSLVAPVNAVASSQKLVRISKKAEKAEALSAVSMKQLDKRDSRLSTKTKELRQVVKGFFNSKEDVPFWLLIVLCILLPPLAVFLKYGIGTEFWISLVLTFIFWLPGVIYALIVVTR